MPTEAVSGTIPVFLLAENCLVRSALAEVPNKKNDTRHVDAQRFLAAGLAANHRTRSSGASAGFARVWILRCGGYYNGGAERTARAKSGHDRHGTRQRSFLRPVRAGVAGYVLKDAPAV